MEQVRTSVEVVVERMKALPPWALALGGTVLGYALFKTLVGARHPNDAKGDKAYPIIGNFLDMKNIERMFEYQKELARKYGRVSTWNLAGKKFFVISDPEINKRIYQTEMEAFGRGGPMVDVFGEIAGGLIMQDNGDEWREVRKFFDPAFSVVSIKNYSPIVQSSTSKLIKYMESELDNPENRRDGAGIDIQPALHGLTFDIIVNILLGFDPKSVDSGGHSVYVKAWEEGLGHLITRVPFASTFYWKWWKTPAVLKYEKDIKLLQGLVMNRYDEYLNNGVPEDAVDLLAQYIRKLKTDKESIPSYLTSDRENFLRHFMTMVFAGHDTTASSVGWTLAFLAMHPDKLARVRKEIQAVGGKKQLTYETLLTLPYLECCVKEVMRLRPSAPNMGRTPRRDITLEWVDDSGVLRQQFVAKGQEMHTTAYATHMDPRNFENPDEFIPERFENNPTYNMYAYVPFGAGPRKCLGEKLALFETRLGAAEVIRTFDFGIIDNYKPVLIQAPTLRIGNGLKLWFKRL
ncbi:hypothetical protein SmJEL517_g03106 [Synchytrium microbalum]|uniref:Cytochrome P450 n=1 Tax=Synchytrium microbalum TaxID=1806994 RepID=A0A507C506_9FUNG|nr:uncharacterized protein SmJEL517_g03106 [Synchytrium microbalum]TPX34199.1 hypothetical protein SmJEL517_g03106 [Synchytrium microbalum]